MQDYCDIFFQVEDCHALHLVKQVTTRMQHLCQLAFDGSISFLWIKALIHIILRSQMPNIRKEMVLQLIEGDFLLNFSDEVVLNWVVNELLPIITQYKSNKPELNLPKIQNISNSWH